MPLLEALGIKKKEVIAITGAGGKTSVMFALGKEASAAGLKVVLTTNTKIYAPQNMHTVVTDQAGQLHQLVNTALTKDNTVVVAKQKALDKLYGLDFPLFAVLLQTDADLIIVEADGAAGRPFKAPAQHEPVIPPHTGKVLAVVGIDCIGKELASESVHRPELVAQIAGIKCGELITTDVVASVFTSKLGQLKNVPSRAEWFPFINKVETKEQLQSAREIAQKINERVAAKVLIGAVRNKQPLQEVWTS